AGVELGDVDGSESRFDLGVDLVVGEDREILAVFGLRQHHGRVVGLSEHLELLVEVLGVSGVDAHDRPSRVEGEIDDRLAGGGLVCGVDGVFEVEDDDVRPLRRLRVPVGAVAGDEAPGGFEFQSHAAHFPDSDWSAAGREAAAWSADYEDSVSWLESNIMVWRTALATSVPY